MRRGAVNKFSVLLLLGFCFFSFACGQTEEEKIKQSHKHEDKALDLREKGKLQAAIQEQNRAVELNAKDANPLVVLAGMYLETGDLQKAANAAQKAVRLNPELAWARHLYANALRRLNEKEKALEQAKEAVRIEPDNALFLTNLGTLYGSLEDKKAEKESYEKALKIDPKYSSALYNLALLEIEDKNESNAITLLKRFIENASPEDKEGIKRATEKLKELEQKKAATQNP